MGKVQIIDVKKIENRRMEEKNSKHNIEKDHTAFIVALTAKIAEFTNSMIGSLVRNLQNANGKSKMGNKEQSDEEQNEDSLSSKKGEQTKRKYAKARSRLPLDTDCQRPKAPTSSFLLYYHENKKELAARFGQTNGSKLTKLASSVWKELPEQERTKYTRISEKEKERYQKEMELFKAKNHEKIEQALKKRRAEYRMNWLNKKKANQVKVKVEFSDNSELSFDQAEHNDPK